jgi:hypothetical protein|tara:strand:+ start:53 stop:628 length:576 start_codon:yes stop_codon:yes gene_type:complete
MAQTSTTLLASKTHIANVTGTDISFTATGTEYKITSTSTSLAGFAVRDLITVTGTSSNNSTFTVKAETSANELIVEEIVTSETSDGSTTTTLDHTGFVSTKVKGDGYYSQPDGVHTVAYQVNSTMAGNIKMQGTLATTPTEDDYFDISGSTFTADQSTLISTANFTGNFVWVRAKATSVTAGTISSILINS